MAFFSHSSASMQGKHEPVPPSVDRAFFVAFFATLLLRAFAFKMHSKLKGTQSARRETQPPDLEAKRPTDEYYNSLARKVAVTNASTSAWVL